MFSIQPALASVREDVRYSYEYSGVFTWGEVITSLCRDGWCRTQLPREFFEMSVPMNVYEQTFDDAFKAFAMQAKADGYRLLKKGRDKPYTIIAEKGVTDQVGYISCVDTAVHKVDVMDLSKHIHADSVKCAAKRAMLDSVRHYETSVHYPATRYRVSFYVVSSSFLNQLGVDWTEVFLQGDLKSAPKLIAAWSLKAVSVNDTTAEFRSIEVDLDSSTTLHWGSQRKEEKGVVTYSTGVSQTDYEWRDYGLTLTLQRDTVAGVRAEYTLAQRDENNSVLRGAFGGGGLDSVSAWGVYDSYQYYERYVPFLSSIPLLGLLFKSESRDKVKSFFVIDVYPIPRHVPNSFSIQDSLRQQDIRAYEYVQDSANN